MLSVGSAVPRLTELPGRSSKGDVMRALDSFFESGGEMPEDGAEDAPMHDDSDDHGLDEEELSRAEAGAGNCTPRHTHSHANMLGVPHSISGCVYGGESKQTTREHEMS